MWLLLVLLSGGPLFAHGSTVGPTSKPILGCRYTDLYAEDVIPGDLALRVANPLGWLSNILPILIDDQLIYANTQPNIDSVRNYTLDQLFNVLYDYPGVTREEYRALHDFAFIHVIERGVSCEGPFILYWYGRRRAWCGWRGC